MPRTTRKPAALRAALVLTLTLTLALALAAAPAAHAAPADRAATSWWSALWNSLARAWPGGPGLASLFAPEGSQMDPNGTPAEPAGSQMDPNGTARPQAGGDMDPNG